MATKAQGNDPIEPNAGTQQEQPEVKLATDSEHKATEKAFYEGAFPTGGKTIRFETRGGETNAIVEKV